MKKYLLTSAAALAFCGLFTSCTHDLGYDGEAAAAQNSVVKTYEQAFVTAFGQPDPNNEWGFGSSTVAATRTITVPGTNDSYDAFNPPTQDEINAAFPTAIPERADEVSDLLTLYNGKPYYNQYNPYATVNSLYDVYVGIVTKGYNLKITKAGEYELGGSYMNLKDGEYQHYNVYVDVDGDVTIKRNGDTHFNLYVIRGNVTIPSEFGKMTGCISVGTGATLNDFRDNGGSGKNGHTIRYFNRGTYNAKNNNGFDLENDATFYNEKIFDVTGPMKYSAGSGNTCYFMSFGPDAEITAPSMTLNSTCHFYTEGTVNISGETKVTQQGITWINNGHYTTGSMYFSAGNSTFYNYCQLIVTGNCSFKDGLFNMMDNSYAEFGTALFNNFHVNMGNNAGFNVKNGSKWGQQGAGIIQGFFAKDNNTTAYVRLAGTTYIPAHKGYAFQASGAKMTIAYEDMKFYKSFNFYIDQAYANSTYSDEITESNPLPQGDERGLADFGNTIQISGNDFSKVGFRLTEGQCAATWHGDEPDPSSDIVRVICEDLSVKDDTDWDFNDAVFDVQLFDNNSKVKITLRAAGGTLPLYIGNDNEAVEIHAKFKEFNPGLSISTGTMLSTGTSNSTGKYAYTGCAVPSYFINNTFGSTNVKEVAKNIPIKVQKLVNGEMQLILLECKKGKATAKVAVNKDFEWCDERYHINDKYRYEDTYGNEYGGFSLFVRGIFSADEWSNYNGPLTPEMVEQLDQ